ncbi:hypothetical protein Tco_1301073 [Tanacetum coccineum]
MAGSNGSNQESSLALKPRGHVRLKKAHGYGEFVLISLSKEAEMSLNMDCHVGNPCEVSCTIGFVFVQSASAELIQFLLTLLFPFLLLQS